MENPGGTLAATVSSESLDGTRTDNDADANKKDAKPTENPGGTPVVTVSTESLDGTTTLNNPNGTMLNEDDMRIQMVPDTSFRVLTVLAL